MIVFVVGGTRSGKSDFALKKALELAENNKKYFIATCPRIDDEISERISKHQLDRQGFDFITIEEQLHISSVLNTIDHGAIVLLDCMTLWINNMLYEASQKNIEIDESEIAKLTLQLIEIARQKGITLISVSNEVGMGLVPSDEVTRKYRDLVGRSNAVMAAQSDEFYLVTCGIPLKLKESDMEQ